MFKFFLIALFLPLETSIGEVVFRKNNSGTLVVSSPTCQESLKIASELYRWKSQVQDGFSILPALRTKKFATTCEVDLSKSLPVFAEKFHGQSFKTSWANCWGVALAAAGITPTITQTNQMAEDIDRWLNPQQCSPITSGSSPQPGDIGRLILKERSGSSNGEIHGFIYINDEIVFSKNGLHSSFKIEIQSAKKMFSETIAQKYKLTCPHLNSSKPDKNCPYQVKFYRCQTLAQMMGNHFISIDYVYLEEDRKLKEIESQFFLEALHGTNDGIDLLIQKFKKNVDQMVDLAESMRNKVRAGSVDAVLWDLIILRSYSLMGYI